MPLYCRASFGFSGQLWPHGAVQPTVRHSTDVRFGSITDIEISRRNVRFTPKSGHRTFAPGLAALMFVDRGLDRRLRLRAGGPTLTRDQLS